MFFIRHATPVNDCFLPDIGCVRIEPLTSIAFIDKDFKFLGVMHRSVSCHVVVDELCSVVGLRVTFVTVEVHLVLLGPPGITVFLEKLVGFEFSGFRGLSGLDLFVLFMGIALPGCFNETGVNHLACIAAVFRLTENDCKYGCENVPVDICFQFHKRIFELGEPFQRGNVRRKVRED